MGFWQGMALALASVMALRDLRQSGEGSGGLTPYLSVRCEESFCESHLHCGCCPQKYGMM